MIQVIEQTDKEKMKMYMTVSKKNLIKMLIQCEKIMEDYRKMFKINPYEKI